MSVTPPTFDDVLGQLPHAARVPALVHSSNKAALKRLCDDDSQPFTLFETPLAENPKTGRALDLHDTRDADAIIGFIADTDASFTLYVEYGQGQPAAFPVTLRAGEFQLAWRNEAMIPCIRIVYHRLWIQDLKGSVRRISACLNTTHRREMAQRYVMALGPEWITCSGMIGKRPVS